MHCCACVVILMRNTKWKMVETLRIFHNLYLSKSLTDKQIGENASHISVCTVVLLWKPCKLKPQNRCDILLKLVEKSSTCASPLKLKHGSTDMKKTRSNKTEHVIYIVSSNLLQWASTVAETMLKASIKYLHQLAINIGLKI